MHYAMIFIISAILRFLWELKTGKQRVILPWSVYMKRVLPTGKNLVNVIIFNLIKNYYFGCPFSRIFFP